MAGDRPPVPLLTELIRQLSGAPQERLDGMVREYDNERVLGEAVREIQEHLEGQFQQ